MTPAATIVICTHDRETLLPRAVEHALREAASAGAEVLVVDNASTDGTPALLHELVGRHGPVLRATHEPHLGLSAARNRGLEDARGAVVAYIDDDAVPRPGWLAALLAPYASDAVACVGGRIALHFAGPPPPWLSPALHPALSAYDMGDAPRRLRYRPGDLYPVGANVSFRVTAARAAGGFSPLVGPLGRRPLVHDETDLCFRLDRRAAEIHYAPAAVVDHWIYPERLTPEYMLARHRAGGESGATCEIRNRGLWRALGKLRWYYRPRFRLWPYAPREPIDAARFAGECERQETLGYVAGLLRGALHLRALRQGGLPGGFDPLPPAQLAAER